MKKIIANIIRLIMPKAVRKHEEDKRIHNAVVLQRLLNLEHAIKDAYNRQNNTVYTTKKACLKALDDGLTDYNCLSSIQNANFR